MTTITTTRASRLGALALLVVGLAVVWMLRV